MESELLGLRDCTATASLRLLLAALPKASKHQYSRHLVDVRPPKVDTILLLYYYLDLLAVASGFCGFSTSDLECRSMLGRPVESFKHYWSLECHICTESSSMQAMLGASQ